MDIDRQSTNKKPVYLDPIQPIDKRVEDLLERMTLEEKIGQLKARGMSLLKMLPELLEGIPTEEEQELRGLFLQTLFKKKSVAEVISANYWEKNWKKVVLEKNKSAIGQLSFALRLLPPKEGAEFANKIQKLALEETRLGIPMIIHDECLHGCAAKGCTIFPQSIALAASWNPDLMKEVAAAIGKETRSRGINQGLSPIINIARDPRCGRTEETYGEDPYLTTAMAVSYVEGIQSRKVAATLKHFVANFAGEGGRDSGEIHISERELREVYFPAFKACIQEVNALSLMVAYNSVDGVPCSCNIHLLSDVLREEWGFKGYVVSDYHSVLDIYTRHKTASTKSEAAKKALVAGLEVELPDTDCYEELLGLAGEGKLSNEVIDEAARRVLRVKFYLGLFEEPYVDPEHAQKICDSEEHRRLSLRAAREAIVLLKNDGLLPLPKNLKSVAVIGPNANKVRVGGYSGYGVKVVTPLQGIKNKVSQETKVHYTEGCKLTEGSGEGFEEAISVAKKSSVAVLFPGNSSMVTEGEQRDRCSLDLPGMQEDLIKEMSNTGTPLVVVLINGSAITISKWIDKVSALVEAWYPGEEGGSAIADVLLGNYNPGGKLPITFPKTAGQLPLYYNHKPTGRISDYVDLRGKQMLFPFGYGLSYTEFEYSNLYERTIRLDFTI